jgi:hypothetical protein
MIHSPTTTPLKSIGGWMIVIAVIAVLVAASRSAGDPVVLILLVIIPPALLMTEIRAKWRRDRGEPMSGRDRVVSVILLMLGQVCLLSFAFMSLSFIAKFFFFR